MEISTVSVKNTSKVVAVINEAGTRLWYRASKTAKGEKRPNLNKTTQELPLVYPTCQAMVMKEKVKRSSRRRGQK